MSAAPGLKLGQFDGRAGLDLVEHALQAGIVGLVALLADGALQVGQRRRGDVAVDQGDANLAQDVEDMVENGEKFSQSKQKETPREPQTKVPIDINKISDGQAKRFYAIAKGQGYTDDDIKHYLKDVHKIESSRDILKTDYDSTIKWAETRMRQPGEE